MTSTRPRRRWHGTWKTNVGFFSGIGIALGMITRFRAGVSTGFILTSFSPRQTRIQRTDYERVYVVETKGLHLKDNAKTDYIRKVFNICTRQAKSRNWNELGLEMKDKVLRFEVLSEDEWEAKLNEMLVAKPEN